ELARRFDEGARLVSLLGIGGTGKTRLATRFGWGWMGEFPGGVWFCDLSPARTVEGLHSAVAQGLQLPLGSEDPVQQIGQAIAGRGECLLVLDNFEQLARHAEATLGRWLDRAPEARFLVTTREVLGIAGEEALAVAPMGPTDAQTLFKRRAAAAKRDFAPGPDDEAAIATLVKLLDGLPLAIELAAARVRTLSPRALLARMSERFKLLASSGGRQDRQATLRAAFDWSWDLLPSAEKMALAQLSVFEGGFTLESAEAVVDFADLADPPWTLDAVNALVDKSFIRSLGEDRFDLLVSVQAYADEHLRTEGRFAGSGPAALVAAQGRHAAFFAALGPRRATENACVELDNLVTACRRSVSVGDSSLATGALDGAWAALHLHGPFKAAIDLAQAVTAMSALPPRQAARAHAVLGSALDAAGDRAQAGRHCEIALEHARAVGDVACEAAVTIRLASLHARQGQADQARAEHGQAAALARSIGDDLLACEALNGLGTVDSSQGRVADALLHYGAALALSRRAGDRRWEGSLLGNLGNLQVSVGRLDEARGLCEQALLIARELGDRKREGNTLCNLGMLQQLQGRADVAGTTLEAALVVARELGHARLECIVLGNLGTVYAALGRPAEALMRYDAAIALARHMGDGHTEGQLLGHAGLALARLTRFDEARASLDAGATLLLQADDRMSLAVLICARAECEWLAGSPEAAIAARDEAQALALQTGAGPESELGAALARLTQVFAVPRSPDPG
ncbi:MAG: tetratricopeptide repeat protein, partial [Rubrivivax sp.]|nr:tetratricopeptide repeat protein [Rubrivivax sp.]